jgi:hypothetical protein
MKGRDLRNGNHVATLRRLSFAESGRLCDSNGHIFNVFLLSPTLAVQM